MCICVFQVVKLDFSVAYCTRPPRLIAIVLLVNMCILLLAIIHAPFGCPGSRFLVQCVFLLFLRHCISPPWLLRMPLHYGTCPILSLLHLPCLCNVFVSSSRPLRLSLLAIVHVLSFIFSLPLLVQCVVVSLFNV